MELLAPAGTPEKLRFAYLYGADAAYFGLGGLSLRDRAGNFDDGDPATLATSLRVAKGSKRLYCAVNRYFQNDELRAFEERLDQVAELPIDAFIVSDLGIVPLLRARMPNCELHLSTQANCTNQEAARMYRDMGFSRIVAARELSLRELSQIKSAVPDLELEAFVHGAMCLAYSGRCFISKWMAGRSGNTGDCAHSCRWEYALHTGDMYLQERERPDEYYPVIEDDGHTMILSSRDLCLIDHLAAFRDAGVDSLKIEGRMKSVYYTAVVTRAYRKAIDAVMDTTAPDPAPFRDALFEVSRREYSTGFYFGNEAVQHPTETSYREEYRFLGVLEANTTEAADSPVPPLSFTAKNVCNIDDEIEALGPDTAKLPLISPVFLDEDGKEVDVIKPSRSYSILGPCDLSPGMVLRRRIYEKERLKT